MDDTPNTDEASFGTGQVSLEFARRMERERNNLLHFVENVVRYGAMASETDGRKAVALLQRYKPDSDALQKIHCITKT
jgi:hypothetical protein